jgi:hypothetical protein
MFIGREQTTGTGKDDGRRGTLRPDSEESEMYAPQSSNFIGRQWHTLKRLHGWRRPVGILAIGVEVLLLAAVVAVLFVI